MATVYLKILGRVIPIACKDGDEDKVQSLAKSLNDTLTDLKIKIPNTQDINLLVIHSLMTMAKIQEADDKSQSTSTVKSNIENSDTQNADTQNVKDETLKTLESTADTLENLAEMLENI